MPREGDYISLPVLFKLRNRTWFVFLIEDNQKRKYYELFMNLFTRLFRESKRGQNYF